MNYNQFRKAAAILFPNVEFRFMNGVNTYCAFAQGANEGLANLFAKKEGDVIIVQQRGESKAERNVYDVLEAAEVVESPEADLLTEEQQKLERVRRLIVGMEAAIMPETDYDNTDYRNGFIEGVKHQHALVIKMLKDVLA